MTEPTLTLDTLMAALRAAAEPTRLRLLALCAQGELTVTELTQILGQSQPRVSRHLKLLCEAGLLERVPEGTWAFYRINDQLPGAPLVRALSGLLPPNDTTLARDAERLGAVKRARAEAAEAYFRDNAAQWSAIRSLHVDEAQVEAKVLKLIEEAGPIGDLLDIGTGTGRLLEILAPQVKRGLGVDLSREMLGIARTNLERAGIRHCQVRQADMYALPLDNASVDAAVIHQVLHFADEPQKVIAEAARVLKPGGHLVIVDFAPHDLEDLRARHAHRRLGFADAELRQWCAAAGLQTDPVIALPGQPLTVHIWRARKRGAVAAHPSSSRESAAA
ncbi:metalloregulator ArsR/SmtB family transcription factor [uncultured Ferrovibrio sp.]|jgi:ubiquinone/menaquinone biosynthesis C-methylase UbiE|uniref:ArsR/SmtB family transcription factor n=1 Tax=uncultured Ferrovibrio sp. TaxID=1576913 RepID=UPI00260DEAE4|nr:metalloregulator ArsR/SmtB family transcription factor [uncultured Ferrovibrio sp.]